ncbi:MAG: DUF4214 domain-containing protein [Armatimonadota bacterium]|nr:DUF4214 domain-containing protein [Armatimonadota bacterium]
MKPSFLSPSRFFLPLLLSAGIVFNHATPVLAAADRQTTAQGIVNSSEYQQKLVHSYYQRFLGRAAQPAEVNAAVNQMKTEGWTAPIVAIVSSDGYFKAAGGSNDKYVAKLFQNLVGRAPDPKEELPSAVDFLAQGGSRQDLAKILAENEQFRANQVQSLYQKLLGRAASEAEVSAGAESLNAAGLDALAVAIVSSEQYFQGKGKNNNNTWLNAVSQDLLGHPASPGGTPPPSTPPPSTPPPATPPAMPPTPPATPPTIPPATPPASPLPGTPPPTPTSSSNARLPMVQALVTSPEYLTNVVNGHYQRFLRRQASATELNYWLGSLQTGGSSDQVILGILVSDEYFKNAGGNTTAFLNRLSQDLLGRASPTTDNPAKTSVQDVIDIIGSIRRKKQP